MKSKAWLAKVLYKAFPLYTIGHLDSIGRGATFQPLSIQNGLLPTVPEDFPQPTSPTAAPTITETPRTLRAMPESLRLCEFQVATRSRFTESSYLLRVP